MSEAKGDTEFNKYVCVVGGINLDIFGRSDKRFIYKDSNPGEVGFAAGGVGRNIAKDLSNLGIKVEFITLFGNDKYADFLKKDCEKNSISLEYSEDNKNYKTPFYLSVQDSNGEMCAAVSDMKLCEEIDIEFIKKRLDVLNAAQLCVLDTNLPKETLKFITKNIEVPIFLDAVSVTKSDKIRSLLKDIHTLKLNQLEAENLSGIEIIDEESVQRAANGIVHNGVGQVFITMGSKGVHYKNLLTENTLYAKQIEAKNTTGAGDAFFAGTIWSYLHDLDIDKMAYYGQAAAVVALKSEFAGAEGLCEDAILSKTEDDIINNRKKAF